MIQHIGYGQSAQDSINQFSIKQSIKCFEEQKSLNVIIQTKDSIIMEITKFDMIKEKELLSETKKLNIANSYLEKEKDKQKFYTIIYRAIAVAEAVVLIIVLAK
jgi:hypothetical protein